MADGQLPFRFDEAEPPAPPPEPLVDQEARDYAVNPAVHVALEASAGTGKTKVLVDRYVNLLRAGVEPRRVLAITFTRKAAAEMRARIVAELTRMAAIGAIPPETWKTLRTHLGEIAISTIDAFCLSLLGEFPLEADVDPGFGVADETEAPRLVDDALDRTLRIGRAQSAHDADLALLFARMGEGRLRGALARLLDRRLVAIGALDRFLARTPPGLTADTAASRAAARLADALGAGRLQRLVATGPDAHDFRLLASLLARTAAPGAAPAPGEIADVLARLRDYTCTRQGTPRKRPLHRKALFPPGAAYQTHAALLGEIGGEVPRLADAHRGDVNAVLARSLRWLTARAIEQYRRTLEEHAVVDFTDALVRALALLERMEEFSQSRYRLESRYQHVLVDELQDTSRPQWALVDLLVRAWGEGVGVAYEGPAPPSLFVVGDRKQSIYGFRDAEVGVLEDAARLIGRLRPGQPARRAIVKSFRAIPALQQFVNDVCDEIEKRSDRVDAFRYDERDRFPVAVDDWSGRPVGLVAGAATGDCARAVAGEIAGLLARRETVRDRESGVRREIAPGDIAILFRSRDSHREFEKELQAAGVPFYVYKGLGFFDADEVKDVIALIGFLGAPGDDRQAAAFLRSRFVRLSDEGLKHLAPRLAAALGAVEAPDALARLGDEDRRVMAEARASSARWLRLADRLPPAELIDTVLHESAYYAEIAGPGRAQARENLKKLRGLVRRLQNRGYATLGRIAARVSQLMAGDESNAIVDALDAVNLMTVHAAKGLEFPVVFVVNLSRGTGGRGDPVEVVTRGVDGDDPDDLVSIDALVPEARAEIEAREREEAKRLVYVALTRARDRLYLATTLARSGVFAPSPTSLGAVLPASLGTALAEAARTTDDRVTWTAATGAAHVCRVVRAAPAIVSAATAATAAAPPSDFAPLVLTGQAVRDVTAMARAAGATGPSGRGDREAAQAFGALVHRAVAAGALAGDDARRRAIVARAGGHLDEAVQARAVEAVSGLARRTDLQALIHGADVQHEVPLSWQTADGTTLRAVVDAVIRRPDGGVTLVEFKTGAPREADERQLAAYVEGVRRLLPGTPVEGRVIRLDG